MKNEEKTQARNLFFETDYSQAQIAKITGISEKTMSAWVNEEQWKQLKERVKNTPTEMIDDLYAEIALINNKIKSRNPDDQTPTLEEAELRKKILTSIKELQSHLSKPNHIEVIINFLQFLAPRFPHLVEDITLAADTYLKGEVKIEVRTQEKYKLAAF